MPESPEPPVQQPFQQVLADCRRLYLEAGRQIAEQFPELILGGSPRDFVDMMDELHKALLVKIFTRVAESDRRFGAAQLQLAVVLFEHIWQERLAGEELVARLRSVSHQASRDAALQPGSTL